MLFEGSVHSEVENRISKAGKPWGLFYAVLKMNVGFGQTADEIVKCILFGETNVTTALKLIRAKDKIIIDGTKEDDKFGVTIKVQGFSIPGKKIESRFKLSKCDKELMDAYFKLREDEGLYRVKVDGLPKLAKKERCVIYNGVIMEKIEFCMEILTPNGVTELLLKHGASLDRDNSRVLEQVYHLAVADLPAGSSVMELT